MNQKIVFVVGLSILALAWCGPLPALARESFAAHMTMHMAVVALAAPILAMALAGTAADPVRIWPRMLTPMTASVAELVVVWMWHAPAWHQAARREGWALLLEQSSFLLAGLALWLAIVGGAADQRRHRGSAGIVALLFTSMHMTLLGALFALATHPLFEHDDHISMRRLSPLADQHLGGAIMLLVGGAVYLAGALIVTARVLRERPTSFDGRVAAPMRSPRGEPLP